jgi:hypothetical protein
MMRQTYATAYNMSSIVMVLPRSAADACLLVGRQHYVERAPGPCTCIKKESKFGPVS